MFMKKWRYYQTQCLKHNIKNIKIVSNYGKVILPRNMDVSRIRYYTSFL